MKIFRLVITMTIGFLACGCVQQSLGSPQVSLDVMQKLRGDDLPSMRVGAFVPASSLPPSADKSVAIRGLILTPPEGGSFAAYLGKTLEVDLRSSGKLDPNSTLVVQGLLTDRQVDAGISDGSALLTARFSLLRDGKVVFDKELSVHSEWSSSFVGAEAIPEAANQYGALYDKLVLALLSDADFKAAALSPPGKISFLEPN